MADLVEKIKTAFDEHGIQVLSLKWIEEHLHLSKTQLRYRGWNLKKLAEEFGVLDQYKGGTHLSGDDIVNKIKTDVERDGVQVLSRKWLQETHQISTTQLIHSGLNVQKLIETFRALEEYKKARLVRDEILDKIKSAVYKHGVKNMKTYPRTNCIIVI